MESRESGMGEERKALCGILLTALEWGVRERMIVRTGRCVLLRFPTPDSRFPAVNADPAAPPSPPVSPLCDHRQRARAGGARRAGGRGQPGAAVGRAASATDCRVAERARRPADPLRPPADRMDPPRPVVASGWAAHRPQRRRACGPGRSGAGDVRRPAAGPCADRGAPARARFDPAAWRRRGVVGAGPAQWPARRSPGRVAPIGRNPGVGGAAAYRCAVDRAGHHAATDRSAAARAGRNPARRQPQLDRPGTRAADLGAGVRPRQWRWQRVRAGRAGGPGRMGVAAAGRRRAGGWRQRTAAGLGAAACPPRVCGHRGGRSHPGAIVGSAVGW